MEIDNAYIEGVSNIYFSPPYLCFPFPNVENVARSSERRSVLLSPLLPIDSWWYEWCTIQNDVFHGLNN